jgi:hypothetical protein
MKNWDLSKWWEENTHGSLLLMEKLSLWVQCSVSAELHLPHPFYSSWFIIS